MDNILEGKFNHYTNNEIKSILDKPYEVAKFIHDILSQNKYLDLSEVRNYFDMEIENNGIITTPINFSFKDIFLKTALKEKPLKVRYIITRGVEQAGQKNATYHPSKGLITLRTDIEENYIDTYNNLIEKINNGKDVVEETLRQAKRDIYFYIHPYLLKMVLVHEMTHWLDDIYDPEIYNHGIKNWIEMTSEKNAIIHQLKLINFDSTKKAWNNYNIFDLLVMIRIRRDYLEYVLNDFLTKDKSWINNIISTLEDEDIPTDNLKLFNPKEIITDDNFIKNRISYQKHYFKKHYEKHI